MTNTVFGPDEFPLRLCSEWRASRARYQMNCAEHNAANLFGSLPDRDLSLDLGPLARMKEIETVLSGWAPESVSAAREMLRVVVTILATRGEDPGGTLGDGPILEIVRHVVESLEYLDDEIQIGPEENAA
jgi:hypothetical protein